MKSRLFFLVVAVALAALLTACGAGGVTSSPNPSTPASGTTDYAALGMSAADIQAWEDRGIANMDSAEQASVLAGFTVRTPGFVPEGLAPISKFMVSDHLAALGDMVNPDVPPYVDVTLVYGFPGERQVVVTVIQGTRALNQGQGEPTTLQGASVERAYLPASEGKPYPSVQYVWEQGGVNYFVEGYLVDGVDETALDQVVCSIINP